MTNAEFIVLHQNEDTRRLAFIKAPEGVDLSYCLSQIEGMQTARTKLPQWAQTAGIVFPPRLSMEQCSSQFTAEYKTQIVSRLLNRPETYPSSNASFTDLTGGFGVDFSFIAREFDEAHYVEHQNRLCEVARHNFHVLGLSHAEVHCMDAEEFLRSMPRQSLIYLDPARRDDVGRKVVALSDCTPNVESLHDTLLQHADRVMIKLSPMLDIHLALRALPCIREVHVVSVDGECKELLFVLANAPQPITYHCVNMGRVQQSVVVAEGEWGNPVVATSPSAFLYEPNASVLKAGVQDVLCNRYGVQKLHAFSNLFTSEALVKDFPGRAFCVNEWCGFGKKDLRTMLANVKQANITVRNFPATVQDIRKRLHLSEGGDVYLFATTLSDGQHVLIRCSKAVYST